MNEIFEKYSKLKELYPDDIATIEEEERRVSDLLAKQDYYNNPQTKVLIALCRKDIVTARMRLAKERDLSEAARAEFWFIIEARSWFLGMVVKDYDTELAQIDQQLEGDLQA
jgi:hypothetical protein